MSPFASVAATSAERTESRAGDDIIPAADVIMDRGFTIAGTPEVLWPWIAQLGKKRAGWYLPRRIERYLPPKRRAIRSVDPRWSVPHIGDVVPDYGGRHETFTVAGMDPPNHLLYRSRRGAATVTWSITLRDIATVNSPQTRVLLRLRMAPVKHIRIACTAGELLDLLTVAGMAAGLRERVMNPT